MLSFKEFCDRKVWIKNAEVVTENESDYNLPAYIYPAKLYIYDMIKGDCDYYLILQNKEFLSTELESLEVRLYNFYKRII